MVSRYPQRYPNAALDRPHDVSRGAKLMKIRANFGSPSRTRTCDHSINSRMLYQLSYRGPFPCRHGSGGQ